MMGRAASGGKSQGDKKRRRKVKWRWACEGHEICAMCWYYRHHSGWIHYDTTVQATPTHPVNQHFKCTNGGNIDELLCKDESSSELVRVLNTTSEKWISIHGMSLFEGARVVEDASRSHDWLLTYLVASCPCTRPSLSVTSFIPEDISGKRRK